MTPFEWVVALTLASIVLSLDFALIKVIIRAGGDFTAMVKQQGQMVHFIVDILREVKLLREEFAELAKAIGVANGVEEYLSDEARQKLGQPLGAGGDD